MDENNTKIPEVTKIPEATKVTELSEDQLDEVAGGRLLADGYTPPLKPRHRPLA